jgi:hypothetical protein
MAADLWNAAVRATTLLVSFVTAVGFGLAVLAALTAGVLGFVFLMVRARQRFGLFGAAVTATAGLWLLLFGLSLLPEGF